MKFDIDPKLENCLILKMLLQPVVETPCSTALERTISITGS